MEGNRNHQRGIRGTLWKRDANGFRQSASKHNRGWPYVLILKQVNKFPELAFETAIGHSAAEGLLTAGTFGTPWLLGSLIPAAGYA
jgi:hypothetical protein